MDLITKILNFIEQNPIIATGLGLSGAGILTFWLKDFPKTIFDFLKKQLTTDLIITNQHNIYCKILKYIDKKYKNRRFRKLKLVTNRWDTGDGEETITSIGYGIHWIMYKHQIFILHLNKEQNSTSDHDKEMLIITKLGRGRKIFDQFIEEVEKFYNNDKDKLKIFRMANDYWSFIKDQSKRNMDSIFIEKSKKDKLIQTLENFLNSEKWYIDHGISYQLGILLYGPPGTGKTSLIKSIATYLSYPIYYLPTSKLYDIDDAMYELPMKCLLVIEDIDSNSVTHSRNKNKKLVPINNKKNTTVKAKVKKINEVSPIDDDLASLYSSSLSNILNALDGLFSVHGRILIATTNHKDELDEALIRPGRIDLQIEIGYVNNEILQGFLNAFFPDDKIDCLHTIIKDNITVAMLQDMVLQKYTSTQIINEISQ